MVALPPPLPRAPCPSWPHQAADRARSKDAIGVRRWQAEVLTVGTVLVMLEERRNEAGILRVRYEKGWVSDCAGNGALILEQVGCAACARARARRWAPPHTRARG